MAAPETLVTAEELNLQLTGEKVRELLGTKGVAVPDPERVQMVLRQGTGCVLGKVQIALKNQSIDELWETIWTPRDKAELKRLAMGATVYYAHLAGQKGEEVPQSVLDELERIEQRCLEIAQHSATVAANAQPASSTQHDFRYSTGCGRDPEGSPRKRWRHF